MTQIPKFRQKMELNFFQKRALSFNETNKKKRCRNSDQSNFLKKMIVYFGWPIFGKFEKPVTVCWKKKLCSNYEYKIKYDKCKQLKRQGPALAAAETVISALAESSTSTSEARALLIIGISISGLWTCSTPRFLPSPRIITTVSIIKLLFLFVDSRLLLFF